MFLIIHIINVIRNFLTDIRLIFFEYEKYGELFLKIYEIKFFDKSPRFWEGLAPSNSEGIFF